MENIYLNDEYSVELIKNLKKYHLDDNVMILTAMKFAKKYHDGQKRKSGEPYYMHPVNVAILVLEFTQFPEPICAALLHDTLEDTEATFDLIENIFGTKVASIVHKLTREVSGDSKTSLAEILERIIITDDYDAALVKLMDKIHNLSTIEFMSEKKIKETIEETYSAKFIGLAASTSINIEKIFIALLDKYHVLHIKPIKKQPEFFNISKF